MHELVDPRMAMPHAGIALQHSMTRRSTGSADVADDEVEVDRLRRREQLLHALEITRRLRRRRSMTRYA